MKYHDRSFPHPVMRPGSDDVSPNSYGVEVKSVVDQQNYLFDINYIIGNATLNSMISAGIAVYAAHFECRNTFYRTISISSESTSRITISSDDLIGTVDVSFYVVATRALEKYRIDGAHLDYGDSSFNINQGDILAIAPSYSFDAEKDYDSLKKLSSILQIIPKEKDGRPFELSFDSDKITIYIYQEDFERYASIKENKNNFPIILQALVTPAIVEALTRIQKSMLDDGGADGLPKWHRVINQRLLEKQIDLLRTGKSINELSQEILEWPIGRFINQLFRDAERGA